MNSVPARPWWSVHTHSKYSVNDALPSVEAIVERAYQLDYPALGLTDHGSVSGSVVLYNACRKVGIEPLPGIELYVVPDTEYASRKDNLHLTVTAYNETGYRNLMHMATLTARRFYYKPRIDFADFAAMAEDGATAGLAISTGCYFGVLPQTLMSRGPYAAQAVASALAGWFPRVYIEMQNHGIDEHKGGDKSYDVTDDELNAGLWDVAQNLGLPIVTTRDSHYVNEADRHLQEALKRMVSWSEDVDDAVFPGGGYFMADYQAMQPYFEPKYLEAGMEGLNDLAEAAYVRLPELERFELKMPEVLPGQDAQKWLEERFMANYEANPVWVKDPRYLKTGRSELDLIRSIAMAPYIVLCIQVADFMRERNISWHVRGSAAGCFVLHATGVSQVDPIKRGLRVDRFLSTNRLKPPDVDFDVEHARRDEVIAMLTHRFSVRSIGSLMKYSLFEDESQPEGDDSSGSLRVKYYSVLHKKGKEAPLWRNIPKADKDMLYSLAGMKLISGYGTHAAGYIVAPDEESVRQLPLAMIPSSKKLVTAYGKKDVEKLGFLKLDLLGLRTRTAIRVMCELADVDFDAIPEDDAATFRMIGAGTTTGVFQLEGYTMQRGCKQLQPKKIEDIIAAQALFRPATMNSGATDDFRSRRRGLSPVPHRHSDIMNATRETFGVLLYQEQVMAVMETLGMSSAQLEEMLDAVKASNEYSEGAAVAIAEMMPTIRGMATDRGWTAVDIDWLADGLGAYADYSFNKAHASSYGEVSYRSAYMRCHYPVDFWTGMLVAYANSPKRKNKVSKEIEYSLAARREDHILILPPHVNRSAATYTKDVERNAIRKGLLSVRGIGEVAARELATKAPYRSLTDMGQRLLPKKVGGAKALALKTPPPDCGGGITALDEVGALDGLEHEHGPDQDA